MENSIAALKSWISNQTKLRQFLRRFSGETTRHIKRLTRSTPCHEGSKSEIRGVGEGIGGQRPTVEGKVRSPLLLAHFGTSDEWSLKTINYKS
ncbi:hypothetical protein AVEN_111896-1 [Araneus ventricosus]|uniref:Uncharacterized protein n=1 Tax=Araneus ventricosus TaxID=182803 RepID=A0A4Y2D3D1_ARAVE|nr:hypothetical protein AVEN_111896-1 [Araneus ventricosus]